MKCGNTVYTKSIMHIYPCHVHLLIFIYNCKFRIVIIFFFYFYIKHLNDRHKLWNNFVKEPNRPFFKCFRKYRVVCVCTHTAYYIDCLVHINAFLNKKSDKFRDYHRRMCIVYLDNRIIGKVIEITSLCSRFINNKLCGIAYHEILLVYSKELSLIVTVIRIEEQCKIFSYILFVEINAFSLNDIFINAVNIKKF